MGDILRDAVKWLIGGGAVALATLLGTTAYQQGQLQIEREKNLRLFLDKYVDIAIRGSFDERLRFVQYWESLEVKDQIGVDFSRYKAALDNEIKTLQGEADSGGIVAQAPARESPGRSARGDRSARPEPPASPDEPPPRQQTPQMPVQQAMPVRTPQQQQAYVDARKSSVDRLIVPDLERQGYDALLARNYDDAMEALTKAERLWPDYHNLSEVRRLLEGKAAALRAGDHAAWKDIYATIVRRYSWGIPPAQLTRLREAAQG